MQFPTKKKTNEWGKKKKRNQIRNPESSKKNLTIHWYLSSYTHKMSIFFSAADAVMSRRWFVVFYLLTLKVAMLQVFLPLRFVSGSVADFSNTGARSLTSAERAFCWPAWRTMLFRCLVWSHDNLSVTILPHQQTPSFIKVTKLFDPGHWAIRFLCLVSGEKGYWPDIGLVNLASHPPWFPIRL